MGLTPLPRRKTRDRVKSPWTGLGGLPRSPPSAKSGSPLPAKPNRLSVDFSHAPPANAVNYEAHMGHCLVTR
jgi:hypothetical protein